VKTTHPLQEKGGV